MTPVVAVCLTADRQELTERAVRCSRRDLYDNARMLVYDTGKEAFLFDEQAFAEQAITVFRPLDLPTTATIGQLRNEANA
ncbi:MAG: hypothetical protein ACREMY_09170, partial [bacterium]